MFREHHRNKKKTPKKQPIGICKVEPSLSDNDFVQQPFDFRIPV
jgi:hypothetical protein